MTLPGSYRCTDILRLGLGIHLIFFVGSLYNCSVAPFKASDLGSSISLVGFPCWSLSTSTVWEINNLAGCTGGGMVRLVARQHGQ